MSNSLIPSQLGYTAPDSSLRSQIYLGRDITVDFEAFGLGKNNRPDVLQALKINITRAAAGETAAKLVSSIYIDVTDVLEIQAATNYPSTNNEKDELFLKLREVSICETKDDGTTEEKRMVVLASQTYPAPAE